MSWTKPRRVAKQWTADELPGHRVPAQVLRLETVAKLCLPLPKSPPKRSEAYRRWVSTLPCAHCGRDGLSQVAHADEGKGMAIKSSDETCAPLCADGPARRGCHSLIGSTGSFTREQRRTLEQDYAAATREEAIKAGAWPKGWA